MEVDRSKFPRKDHYVGREIRSRRDGKFLATVKAVKERTLVLNFNHPLAGKAIVISLEIVSIDGSRDNGE
jgi:FKBP-type peptidyl-prolyl cis-trans isomerase 2